jgi:hypothetical protein
MVRLILMIAVIKLLSIQSIMAGGGDIPYYKSKGIIRSDEVKNSNSYTQFDILIHETDPRTRVPIKVKAHYFKNKKQGRLPLLIIVPPIDGVSIREKSVTKHFIGQGYSTLVIEPVRNISDSSVSIAEFENNLLSFVGAVRSAIDVMVEKPEIDSNNIFVWASSMGAIYTSIVIGEDKRINSGIIILGGGSIPDIVTDSKQKYIVRYKTERMIKEGLTENAFRQKMKEAVKVDPLHYARLRTSPEIFFIKANKDTSVPSKYQQALYESFGSPEHCKKYKGGHVGALMKSHLFKLKSYSDFTNGRLKK